MSRLFTRQLADVELTSDGDHQPVLTVPPNQIWTVKTILVWTSSSSPLTATIYYTLASGHPVKVFQDTAFRDGSPGLVSPWTNLLAGDVAEAYLAGLPGGSVVNVLVSGLVIEL